RPSAWSMTTPLIVSGTKRSNQMNNRGAGTAVGFASQGEGGHVRMFGENRMHRLAQLADPFAVNDPHLQNAERPAFGEVIGHDALDIRGTERVQVQHAVDGQFERPRSILLAVFAVVHTPKF